MRKTKTAVIIMAIATIFLGVVTLWLNNTIAPTGQNPIANVDQAQNTTENSGSKPAQIPVSALGLDPTTNPAPTPSPYSTQPHSIDKPSTDCFANITICTDRKTQTYEVMSNVDKKTLKKNIGWLPGSAMPGEDGCCVLMGHRDMDFSILKDIVIGNKLIIDKGNTSYTYKVIDIQVVENNMELCFPAQSKRCVILVTCYPFQYSGHAPQKMVVYATIN